MDTPFSRLPAARRAAITRAALEVFGSSDYKRASTDEIAARAEGVRLTARVQGGESLPALLALGAEYGARDLETHGLTLEESFYQYYEKEARQ